MSRKILLTLLAFVLCLPQLASAQMGRWGDSLENEDMAAEIASGRFRPFMEADWGTTQPRFEGLSSSFATTGVIELKLGFAALDSAARGVKSLDERYAFGSYFSEDVNPGTPEEGDIVTKPGRFGLGNRLGYGFGSGGFNFGMYNQNSLNWTSVEAENYDDLDAESQAVFDRYGTSLRFGQLFEAGLKIRLSRSLAITGGVEGAVIFPRHVFWEWAGSAAIYSVTQGGIQYFTAAITKSSPVVGPLLNFALKTGVSWAYYVFQREDMNWPFESETPLTLESAKLGVTLTF